MEGLTAVNQSCLVYLLQMDYSARKILLRLHPLYSTPSSLNNADSNNKILLLLLIIIVGGFLCIFARWPTFCRWVH